MEIFRREITGWQWALLWVVVMLLGLWLNGSIDFGKKKSKWSLDISKAKAEGMPDHYYGGWQQ